MNGSPKLILVKHAQPEIVPGVSPHEWQLSIVGQQQSVALAEALTIYNPQYIAASPEPKATQTAAIVAARLNTPLRIYEGLHEHTRRTAGFYLNKMDFEHAVQSFFAEPARMTFGEETAAQARDRFSKEVHTLLDQTPKEGNIVVVAHGTVISLYVALYNSIDPFALWQRLGLPSFAVLTLPDFALDTLVDHI